jgi:diacylglycerol kinase (ATP)
LKLSTCRSDKAVIARFFRLRARSFRHAFAGWWYVLRTQQNAWIHATISSVVLILAFLLHLEARDWAILILAIALVWMGEFLNTALEAVVDLASPEHHPLAKIGKDVGAAAVLIAAIASVIIGLLILGPPLWALTITFFQFK